MSEKEPKLNIHNEIVTPKTQIQRSFIQQQHREISSSSNKICVKDEVRTSYDPFLYSYFSELNHARRDFTFPAFINRTDEKQQTEKALTSFLYSYLSYFIKDCKVLDIGTGEGDLSERTAKIFQNKCWHLNYTGIDRSASFVTATRKKLRGLDIDNTIIQGDAFAREELDKLAHDPLLLVVKLPRICGVELSNLF